MDHSDSASLTTGSLGQSESGHSGQVSITGTNLPLTLVSAYQDEQVRHKEEKLPNLPSHRYRYSIWHDLNGAAVTGDQLRAPRVRRGPTEKEQMFYRVRDGNNRRLHHSRKGRDRHIYQRTTENWENTVHANLSYQDLGQGYQQSEFLRILKRLMRAEEIILMSNGLTDIVSCSFPRCDILNLTDNYLKSFKQLPKIPQIKHLNLDQNDIEDVKGIECLKSSPIESLSLQSNPVTFTLNYRQRVFKALTQLKILDGLPKVKDDDNFEDDDYKHPGSCVIT